MILPTRRWRVFYFQETSMSSNFERSQQTKVMISSGTGNGRNAEFCQFS